MTDIIYDGERFTEYQCTECGMHVIEEYSYCPYCGIYLGDNWQQYALENLGKTGKTDGYST